MISVVMGVYNGEKSVERSIRSILSGNYTDLEFIVVDDGSTDGTFAILEKLASEDSRLIIIKSDKNYGLANALNKAIAKSSGNFIARMDADDSSNKARLSRQMDYLEAHSDIAFVGAGAMLVDEIGKMWGERIYPQVVTSKILIKHNPFIHPTLLFRKEALLAVGNYCEEPYCYRCEDYDLYFRLYSKGFFGENMEETLLDYTEKNNSSERHSKQTRKNEFTVRKRGTKLLKGNILDYFYCIKPLFLMMLSDKMYNKLHNQKWRSNEKI